jgi:signal transduction histidine kinase
MRSIYFILRFTLRWFAVAIVVVVLVHEVLRVRTDWVPGTLLPVTLIAALITAFSHVRRVQLISDKVDAETLASRHRRRIEMPLPPAEAFDMVEAAIRELPHVENVETARDSLQLRARVRRVDPYIGSKKGGRPQAHRNQVMATVSPGDHTSSVTLICQPEGGALVDWFAVDHGSNLENMDALTRALTRRIADRRKGEETAARATASDKELAEARLSMLHAQVEPHFLYTPLASAQLLTRSDPARADLMLGHLVAYLRNSLPRTESGMSTLGDELDRTQAYLEIMKIRMGERLTLSVQVPDAVRATPLPTMMLQTLAENAIKHGLEPVPGGGTLWIFARARDGQVGITVADDGRGFSDEGGGTGIGLRNLRERLKLAYGNAAAFSIVANFPRGVAATLTVPAQATAHA